MLVHEGWGVGQEPSVVPGHVVEERADIERDSAGLLRLLDEDLADNAGPDEHERSGARFRPNLGRDLAVHLKNRALAG